MAFDRRMPTRWTSRAALWVVAAALLAVACVPPAAATDAPGRFVVLQTAYYSFAQAGPTNQSSIQRAVLLEQASPASGPDGDLQHNASDALLANTTRLQLVMIEYQAPAGSNPLAAPTASNRLPEYYKADRVPTTIIDGTRRIVAFAPNSPETFASTRAAAAAVPAGAAITVSGGIVLQNGHLDVEVSTSGDLTGTQVYLRAVLVEDHLPSPADGRDLRYVARALLGNLRVVEGHADGRFNFPVDAGWVESHLGAVVFVQSDGPVEGSPPGPGAPADDALGTLLLWAAPVAMVGVLSLLVLVFARRERRHGR